jgi:putative hydrolase of the HAD superfamily
VLVFVDADNTLWDTNAVYASAQLELLKAIEARLGIESEADDRLGFVREFDQGLAERHHLGLRYPTKFLIRALALGLEGNTPSDSVRRAWSQTHATTAISEEDAARIEGDFARALDSLPTLRKGVHEGLVGLQRNRFRVIVLTESSTSRVLSIADALRIRDLFERVLEIRKQVATLKRMRAALGHPRLNVIVGDQLDRDIEPAMEAGFKTVYFPGGFRPQWEREVEAVKPDFTISSFAQVPGIVRDLST